MNHPSVRVGALLLAFASALGAEEKTEDRSPPESAEETAALTVFHDELQVAARPIASPAAKVTLIDREAIEVSNARTVGELLSQVVGVHVLGQGSRGGLTYAQVRGGDPNFSLVLLDGVLLNNPTDLEGGAVNLANLSVTHVDRIDVAGGPHSYFYGPNALSGLINIVTRRAVSSTPAARLGVEAGDFSLLRADASTASRSGERDFFVGGEWEEEEGRQGDDVFEQLTVHGSFGRALGDRADLRLTARGVTRETADYPDASGGPVFGSGELRLTESDELGIGADLVLISSARLNHRVNSSLARHGIERSSPAIAPIIPPSREDITYTRWRTSWLSSLVASERIVLNAGADVEFEDASNESTLSLPPFLGGDVAGDYELSRTTPGAFVEIATSRGDLLVEAGLRADLPEDRGTEWSPRLALRYRPAGKKTVFKASASRAFKLPSFLALGSPPALGGNPALRPETSEGVDLGVERDFASGRGQAGLALFLVRYEDLIEFDFEQFRLLNRSRVESSGVESFLRWRVTPRLRLRANLTWQDVEDLDVADTPLHQPEWLGSAGVVWQVREPLIVSLDGSLVSESLDQQLTVPDRSSVDGYELLNLNLIWKTRGAWQVRAHVENLTDESYEQYIGFPGARRSLRVALAYDFARSGESD